MGVRKVIVVVAVGAALLPSVSSAQNSCATRANLTDQLSPLQVERDRLAQILKNFGFENTVAEQQALGNDAADILRNHGVNARKDFMDKTASEAATAMQGLLKNMEKAGGQVLTAAERGQLLQLARRLPAQARTAIMKIAESPVRPLPGAAVWGQALEGVGIASTLYKVATTDSAARAAWEGFMGAAGIVNAPLGLMIANVDYAVNNLLDVGKLVWTQQQIKALTNATEADLELMKSTTARMKTVAQQLGKITRDLASLPPCDSTQIRRPESNAPPQLPNLPTPPENTSGNGSGGGGGGGMGAGSIVGYSAAAVGAGVGAKMLSDYQKKLQCDQYETKVQSDVQNVVNASNAIISCGQSISCINSRQNTLNNASSGLLATAGEWCNCLGPSATSEISSADKAMLRDLLNQLRGLGVTSGTLPSCFR